MRKLPAILIGALALLLAATSSWAQQKSLVISDTDLHLTEGGRFSFSVRLGSQPTGNVTVTVKPVRDDLLEVNTSLITNGIQNGEKKTTLTFNTSNWDEDQTVTLFSSRDSDSADESTQVNLSASGGGFDGATGKVRVSVMDADAGGLVVSEKWLGYLFTYRRLATAFEDRESARLLRRAVRTKGSTQGVRYKSTSFPQSHQFTVKLASRPKAGSKTTVAAISTSPVWVQVTPAMHEWSADDWNQPKIFTITQAPIDRNGPMSAQLQQESDETHQIFLVRRIKEDGDQAIDQGIYQGTGIVDVELVDNRLADGGVTLLESSARLSRGSVGTVAAALSRGTSLGDWIDVEAYIPDGDKSRLEIVGSAKHRYYVNQPGDLQKFRNFTYLVKEDADIDGGHAQIRFRVTEDRHSDTSFYLSDARAYVYIEDRTVPSMRITRIAPVDDPGNPTERGTATINLKLGAMPAAASLSGIPGRVSVFADSSDPSLVTISPSVLEFTRSNWNRNQTLTLTGVDDIDALNESVKLKFAARGGRFDEASGGPVDVKIVENFKVFDDDATFVLSQSPPDIDEGGSGALRARLKGRPSANVTVVLSSSDLGAMTVSPASLEFTDSNWNTDQTITVSGVHDLDAVDENVHLILRASGAEEFQGKEAAAQIKVDDDETANLMVTPTRLSITEGGEKTFTVKLASRPSGNVVLNLEQSGTTNADVTIDTDTGSAGDQKTLTFTSSNWNQAQTVTVRAGEDNDAANDSAGISITALGGGYGNLRGSVVVDVIDNDTGSLTISATHLRMAEGTSDAFTVALTTRPSADVTVEMSSSNPDVTVDIDTATAGNQTTLSFTASDWSTPRAVRVSAAADEDGLPDHATLSIRSKSGDANYGSLARLVSISVTDSTPPSLALSTKKVDIVEGGSGYVTVRPSAQPSVDVRVSVDPISNADVTVDADSDRPGNQNTVTFTPSNWNTPRKISFYTAQDDDGMDESVTVSLAASGGEYENITSGNIQISISDDDPRNLSISACTSPTECNLTFDEGSSAFFTVALTTMPLGGNVTVSVRLLRGSGMTVDTDTSQTGNQNTLTFTDANWEVPQMVTVSAPEKDNSNADETDRVRLEATGGDYTERPGGGAYSGTVNVTATDNDRGLVVSPKSLELDEGNSGTFSVKLKSSPKGGNVTVTLSSSLPAVTLDTDPDTFGNQTTLTFTSANWDNARTVTVRALNDNDNNDYEKVAEISLSASGADYGAALVSDKVKVTVTDDDVPEGLEIEPSRLTVSEGSTAQFEVMLSIQPSAPVAVTLTSSESETTLSPTSLNFTDSNWDKAQSVRVSAAEDDDSDYETPVLSLSASGGGYASVTGKVDVTVSDNDYFIVNPVASGQVEINEGLSKTLTVKLAAQPSAAGVIANIDHRPPFSNQDITVTPRILSFTSSNWNTTQQLTLTSVHDGDVGNDIGSLSIRSVDGKFTESIALRVNDDDSVGLQISERSLTLVEGGSQKTFTARLTSKPDSDVILTLSSNNTGVTIDKTRLTFTTANWMRTQTVTVRAIRDGDTANGSATISIAASGGGYTNKSASIAITTTDTDTLGLVLSDTTLSLDEGGPGDFFTVKLGTPPSATVTIDLAFHGGSGQSRFDSTRFSPDTLTFTADDWDTEQSVTVIANHDNDASAELDRIDLTAKGGDYEGKSARVEITVKDDDSIALIIEADTDPLTVDEGGSETFTVRLETQPSADVTVTLTQPSNTDVTVDSDTGAAGNQTTLRFTASDWNAKQRVRVSATHDNDAADDRASVALTAAGGDYAGIEGSLSVKVDDDDTPSLAMFPNPLNITEGESGEFAVKLATRPSANVSITLGQPSNSDVSMNPTSLTFTPANWNTPKTVTIDADEDDDTTDDDASISLTAAGGDYAGVSASMAVKISDADSAGLTLSPTTLIIGEGRGGLFEVKLAKRPTANVTVNLTQSGTANPDITFDTDDSTAGNQTSLTFTGDNWSVSQTVTVDAAEDQDAANDSARIDLTASGATEYGSVTGNLSITVMDNDTPALTVVADAEPLVITEGGNKSFTVRLSHPPSANISVSLTQSGAANSDISFDTDAAALGNQTSLTFTDDNWNSPQTVTIEAGEDQDTADESASIELTASGAEYAGVSRILSVSVRDNDSAGLIFPSTLTVTEGSSGDFDVKLRTRPSAGVTVRLAKVGPTEVELDKSTLLFTTSDWDTPQRVRVSAKEEIIEDISDNLVTIDIAASGGGYDNIGGRLRVTVKDNDIVALILSSTDLEVSEGGSNTFTVKLAARPISNASISLASNSADVTLNPTTLSYTRNDWNDLKTVTVSAAQDSDTSDDPATIDLTGTSIVPASVKITTMEIIDAYRNRNFVIADEGSSSSTFTYVLERRPDNDRTIVATTDHADLTIATGDNTPSRTLTLTFTPANWNTAQTIEIGPAHDSDATDHERHVNFDLGPGLAHKSGVSYALDVSIRDDDIGLTLSQTSLTVTEGASETFKVKLGARPGQRLGRTVSLVSSNSRVTIDTDPDTAGNQTTLAFDNSNWDDDQSVSIGALEDGDAIDNSAAATIGLSGAGLKQASVTVNTAEPIEAFRSENGIVVTEGSSSSTFHYVLESRPPNDRTIKMRSTDDDLKLSANGSAFSREISLTFTPADWNTRQTVTVSAARDNDSSDRNEYIDSDLGPGLVHKSGVSERLTVNVKDEDIGLILAPTSLELAEGTSGSFTIKLARQPASNTTIALAASGGANSPDIGFSPASLPFTTTNWNSAQTVTVTTTADADTTDDTKTISLTGTRIESASLVITARETFGLILSRTNLDVNEGASETFTVKMNAQPADNRTVSIVSDATDAATVNPTSLIFTPANWNNTQEVTVNGAADRDKDESATITLSGDQMTGATVTARVFEVIEATRNKDKVTVTEGTSTETFTYVLKSKPSEYPRTIRIRTSHAPIKIATGNNNPSRTLTLTFDKDNYSTAQTITVSVAHDDDAISGDLYIDSTLGKGLAHDSDSTTSDSRLVAKIKDDDIPLTFDKASLSVDEGESGAFTVRLSKQPPGKDNRTVTLAGTGSPDINFSPSTLTFTGADNTGNWNSPQTVTVTTTKDSDTVDDSKTVNFTGTSIFPSSLVIYATEVVGLTLSDTSPSAYEGTDTYLDVKLSSQPAGDRVVNLTSNDNTITFLPNPLTFTNTNWNQNQTVTIRTVEDSDNQDDRSTITLDGVGIDETTVTLTVIETIRAYRSKVVGKMDNALANEIVADEGTSDTAFSYVLDRAPPANRRIELSTTHADIKVATEGGAPSRTLTLTFTPTNWNTKQTVNISVAEDSDKSDRTEYIDFELSDGLAHRNTVGSRLETLIRDNDIQIESSLASLSIVEGDSNSGVSIGVRLGSSPSAGGDRAVELDPDNDDIIIAPKSLTFTNANWNNYQYATVTAAKDADTTDDRANIAISGAALISTEVSVDVLEAVRAIREDADNNKNFNSIDIAEGSSTSFTYVLESRPPENRIIKLTSSPADLLIATGNDVPSRNLTLTFTPTNWNQKQTVNLSAAHDADSMDIEASISIALQNLVHADGTNNNLAVNIIDDDIALELDPTSLELAEGTSGTFTVKLAKQPASNATIALASASGGANSPDISFSPASLSFTTTNWNSPQTVTVTTTADADTTDDKKTIDLTGAKVRSASLVVTAREVFGLTLSTTNLTVTENESKTFTVKLASMPGDNRRVNFESSDSALAIDTDPDTTGNQSALTFSGGNDGNWNSARTVTVTAIEDDNHSDDSATISLSGEGITAASISVSALEAIKIKMSGPDSNGNIAVDEGSSKLLYIELSRSPGSRRAIEFSSGHSDINLVDVSTGLTRRRVSLAFDSTNWSTSKRLLVTSRQDNDAADRKVDITITGEGISKEITIPITGQNDATASSPIVVLLRDDDKHRLTLSKTSSTLLEGASDRFTVRLDRQPVNNIIVDLASDNSDITLGQASLVFTRDNWDDDRTVSVNAAADSDSTDDISKIDLSGGEIVDASVTVNVLEAIDAFRDSNEITVPEGTSTSHFSYRLESRPAVNRTIDIATGHSDLTLSAGGAASRNLELTFTPDNWNRSQRVTVSAAHDSDVTEREENINFTLGLGLSHKSGVNDSLKAFIREDDITLTLIDTQLDIKEGTNKDFTVKASSALLKDRTVNLRSSDTDITLSPTSLTFTGGDSGNWNTPQTVTVRAAADDDLQDDNSTITLGGDGFADTTVNIKSLEVIQAERNRNYIEVDEGTSTANFTYVLKSRPTSDRTIVLNTSHADLTLATGSDDASRTFARSLTLTFTSQNWDQAQTITAKSAHDADATNRTVYINFTLDAGLDHTSNSNWRMSVLLKDDDVSLTLSPTTLQVAEGYSRFFSVRLAKQPPGKSNRTISLSSNNADARLDKTTLSFDGGDNRWNLPQQVGVAAVADDDTTDDSAIITLEGSGILTKTLNVGIDENVDLAASPTILKIVEGESGTFNVKLNARPNNNRTITMQAGDSAITLSPSSLTFTNGNWNVEQTVTASLAVDNDNDEKQASIAFLEGGVSVNQITLHMLDSLKITRNKNEIEVNEGTPMATTLAKETFTYVMESAPSAGNDRTIELTTTHSGLTLSDITAGASNPSSEVTLNFTHLNWDTVRTIRLHAAHDSDAADSEEYVDIDLGSGLVHKSGTNARLSVDIIDDDIALSLAPTRLDLNDGGSGNFTVKLAEQPPGKDNKTITLSLPPKASPPSKYNADITFDTDPDSAGNQSTLTFTGADGGNWNTPQRVSVTSTADNESDDDNRRTINFGGATGVGSASLVVTAYEIKEAVTNKTSLTMSENATETFTVKLNARPELDRTLDLASDNADITLSPSSLSFTGGNWNVDQTVTITAAIDDDSSDDNSTIRITGLGIKSASIPLTVQEIEKIDLVLSQSSLGLLEGNNVSFTVKLSARPADDTTIDMASDNSDITVSPTSLTFTGGNDGNWNGAQTVTVSATADSDANDDSGNIELTGGVYIAEGNLPVSVLEPIESVRNVNTVSAIEGTSTTTFTYVLKTRPSGNRTISLGTSHADLQIATGTDTPSADIILTFTPDNWNQAQTVKITVGPDDDGADSAEYISPTFGLGLAHSSEVTERLTVSIIDDDIALTLDKSSLEATADGGKEEFTVKLAKQPPGKDNRTITLASGDAGIVAIDDTDPDTSGAQNTLTFTGADNGNWNTPQRVMVTIKDDSNATDDNTTINLTGTGIVSQRLPVATKEAIGLVLSTTSLELFNSQPSSFTVKLASQPSSDRTIEVTIPEDDDFPANIRTKIAIDTDAARSGNQNTLTFTGGDDGNWNTPQTVNINNTLPENSNVEHELSLQGLGITASTMDFSIIDERLLYLSRSVDSVALDEGTSTSVLTYTIHRQLNPSTDSDREIVLNSSDASLKLSTGDGAPSQALTLTFSIDEPTVRTKTVTIHAGHDSDTTDNIEEIDTVLDNKMAYGTQSSHLSNGVSPSKISVTIRDDDVGLTLAPISILELDEGAGAVQGTFTVKLSKQPPKKDNKTISLSVVTDSPDITFSPTTLQFTGGDSGNWNTAQTVTVRGGADADAIDDIETIALTGDHVVSTEFTVVIKDGIALDLSDLPLRLAEKTSGTFKVKLASQPTTGRTVTLAPSDSSIALDTDPDTSGNQSTLTFTGGNDGNWNTSQTITVIASKDSDDSDDSESIQLGGVGIIDRSADVRVWESIDIDRSHDSLVVDEGSTTTFTLALKRRPDNNRTLVLQSSHADINLGLGSTPSARLSLTFTPTNWNIAQTVTVNAAHDNDQADRNERIDFTGFGLAYNDLVAISKLDVMVRDDDVLRTVLSGSSLSLTEGGSTTFTVKLNRQPSVDRTVSLTSDNSDITLSPASMTFTAGNNGNWNNARTVTLRAATDSDALDDTATINLAGSGVRGGTLIAWVLDAIRLTRSTSTLTVTESRSQTFTVKLASEPTRNRIIDLTSNDSDVTIDTDPTTPGNQTTLTLGDHNWDIDQSVMVKVAADNDDDDGSATIAFSGGGIVAAAVTVNTREPIPVDRSLDYLAVDKGSSSIFTIALKKRPDNDRTIVMESAHADINLSTGGGASSRRLSLTFTPSDWNGARTVTVARAAASTTRNEYIDFTGVGLVLPVRLEVALSEDAVLLLSESSLTIDEGTSKEFTARLTSRPTANVTVTLSQKGGGNSDVTLDTDPATAGNQSALIFTTSNWNTARTVKVSAAEDDDAVADTATITLSASGGGHDSAARNMIVRVRDNDRVSLMPSTRALTVVEGGSGTLTFRLTAEPAAEEIVTIEGHTIDPDITLASGHVSRQTITHLFNTSNWKDPVTVTVNAAEDDDQTDDSASYKMIGPGITAANRLITVTVADNDTEGLAPSPNSLDIAEGKSDDFSVRLTKQPTGTVTVILSQTGPGNSDVTFDTDLGTAGNQDSLTFTTSNWNQERSVRVNAAEDEDIDNDAATITVIALGGGYNNISKSVSVSIIDDDPIGLILSSSELTVGEGESGAFTVRLNSPPSENVMVNLSQSGAANSDIDASPTSLTFTTTDWNSDQTITVSAAEDNDDTANETAEIRVSATGGGYDEVTATVSIVLTDDDAGTLVLPSNAVALTEGNAATFNMKLSAQPTDDVTVRLRQPDNSDVKVADTDPGTPGDQNTLTFTASNWNTDQRVRVSTSEDGDTDDETAEIRVSAAGGGYDDATGSVTVNLTDDDTGILTLSTTSITVGEGSSATFMVGLSARPSATVTVSLPSIANTDVTVDKASLTFTTGNWDRDQPITVRAAEDNDDTASERAIITLNGSGGGYGDAGATVIVNVTDDDAGTFTLPSSAVALTEGGAATFDVKLSAQPTASVTVTLRQPDNTDVKVADTDPGTNGDQNTLIFTTSDWDRSQRVTISAEEDGDADNENAEIRVSATGGGYGDATGTVRVDVTDNDTPGMTVSKSALTVGEGSSGTFTVKLDTQPSANVTVGITQPTGPDSPNVDVTTTPASLTFTSENWDRAQTVTVNATDDHDGIDDRATLRFSATGGDYDNVADEDVVVTVSDNDPLGLTVSVSTLTVAEGSSNTFTVKLDTQPSAEVTVSITQKSGAANAEMTVSQASLTFTPANWSTTQEVTVSGADDADGFDDSITLVIDANGGGYDDVAKEEVVVTVGDDDPLGVTVSVSTLTVNEGSSNTFTVNLDTRPSADVTVSITQKSGAANTDVTSSRASLTFTTGNWDRAQTVTVNAADDADGIDDSTTLVIDANRGGYDDVADEEVVVRVDDDDSLGITVSKSALTVNEGSSGTFTVELDTRPSASVMVNITQPTSPDSPNADVTATPASLTFTTDNWDTPRTVTVNGAEDQDGFDDSATLRVRTNGGGYDNVTYEEVVVTVDDNDIPEIIVSVSTLTVDEGSNGAFTVELDTEPSASVTVNITQPTNSNADVTTTPA
ncbi:MAG: hypothetical protein ISN28_06690, partial [Ectothiorhodospiraceae bacterium AqS1]|nr:hypothetical protein [Ectothiorhodospiraceae bacterium AqS1]